MGCSLGLRCVSQDFWSSNKLPAIGAWSSEAVWGQDNIFILWCCEVGIQWDMGSHPSVTFNSVAILHGGTEMSSQAGWPCTGILSFIHSPWLCRFLASWYSLLVPAQPTATFHIWVPLLGGGSFTVLQSYLTDTLMTAHSITEPISSKDTSDLGTSLGLCQTSQSVSPLCIDLIWRTYSQQFSGCTTQVPGASCDFTPTFLCCRRACQKEVD